MERFLYAKAFDPQRRSPSGEYFCEDPRDYHVAVAGSLLGITLHPGVSFPVGKVDMLSLRPMDFREFLLALGKNNLVESLDHGDWNVLTGIHSMMVELLRQYYFVGGMPEAVNLYVATNDPIEVRKVQQNILLAYRDDISKHAPTNEAMRIGQVWKSIPSQLAKENKKFIFSAVRSGARAKDFELAIQWLIDSGLVYKVNRISKPTLPLSFYEDMNVFKLFVLDCGLLGAMSETPPSRMLLGSDVFEEYKGAFTENFVQCQLATIPDMRICYYTNENSTLEIDFVVQLDDRIIPIEAKAEISTQAKSFKQFLSDNPSLKGIRLSMLPYRDQERLVNYPLYSLPFSFSK